MTNFLDSKNNNMSKINQKKSQEVFFHDLPDRKSHSLSITWLNITGNIHSGL